jgi:signal transduction histidine kinase/ActR/RegA family two-component response regulator
VSIPSDTSSERALILAPHGRDAHVAAGILSEGGLVAEICHDLQQLTTAVVQGAGMAVLTDSVIRDADIRALADWVDAQPPWSDFPFVLLTKRGAGLERNPDASREMAALGNVIFLERPFHPTTFISVVRTALRGRLRQYEARARLEALHASEALARSAEAELRRVNETLESRVAERTAELAATNRQLMAQIEERQRVESTLQQMQRQEAIGQLTSGVAHDFNNLLTVVLGNIGFLEKAGATGSDPKLRQRLSHMRLATERGAKLTSQLLAFSRRQRLEPKPFDMNDSLENMHGLLQSTVGGGIRLSTRFQPGIWPALADPAQIELVVLNLVINARDAMGNEGTITIETSNSRLGPPERPEEPAAGEYVMVAVRDTGSGMSKEVLAKAFEPFFTTKEVGKGSGLGLSQVLGFAKQSGGGIRIETRIGEGTSVRVYLPRAPGESVLESATTITADQTEVKRRGAVILLVDDDSAVREVTGSILEEIGYVVLKVGSGGAALELLERHTKVDLVLLDFAMPGMSGVELARQIQQKSPALPVLFVTGYADKIGLGDVGEERIIKKPFVDDELTAKISAALARSSRRPSDKVVVALRR